MGTGSLPGIEWPRSGVNHALHLPPKLKRSRAIPLLHLRAFMTGYRVTFTFNFLFLLSYEAVQSLQEIQNTVRLQAISNDKFSTLKIALRSYLGDSHFQSPAVIQLFISSRRHYAVRLLALRYEIRFLGQTSDMCLFQHVQTGRGNHPASYFNGNRG